MKAKHRKQRRNASDTSPLKLLSEELRSLRRDLRATARAYTARLEIALAESSAVIAASAAAETLPRERLHEFRDLAALVRKRDVKPEKGRRKDLRKLDGIIDDLHSVTHPTHRANGDR